MIDWLGWSILAMLFTHRATQLLVVDTGMFEVFLKFRIGMGVYDLGEDGEPKSELGKLFACPYCVGAWLSILATILVFTAVQVPGWPNDIARALLVCGAIGGAQSLLQDLSHSLSPERS